MVWSCEIRNRVKLTKFSDEGKLCFRIIRRTDCETRSMRCLSTRYLEHKWWLHLPILTTPTLWQNVFGIIISSFQHYLASQISLEYSLGSRIENSDPLNKFAWTNPVLRINYWNNIYTWVIYLQFHTAFTNWLINVTTVKPEYRHLSHVMHWLVAFSGGSQKLPQ